MNGQDVIFKDLAGLQTSKIVRAGSAGSPLDKNSNEVRHLTLTSPGITESTLSVSKKSADPDVVDGGDPASGGTAADTPLEVVPLDDTSVAGDPVPGTLASNESRKDWIRAFLCCFRSYPNR